MKITAITVLTGLSFFLSACKKEEEVPKEQVSISPITEELKKMDMPILPIEEGDYWKYKVEVEIPPGITSEGSAAVELETEKTRTFLGKIQVTEDYPEVAAFEVVVPGQATERELVEIRDDSVWMLGSYHPSMPDTKPIWIDPPIPFVLAGSRAGLKMSPITAAEGAVEREVKVVGREIITLDSEEYQTIRLLMTGRDGKSEIRRTTWFAPGIGIIKEEKTRYAAEKLLFREMTELVETNVTKK